MINIEVIYYFMEHCHFCKEFNSTWEQIVNLFNKKKNIKLKKIDKRNMTSEDTINGERISGFPTIKIIATKYQKTGIVVSEAEYTSSRTFEKLSTYLYAMISQL